MSSGKTLCRVPLLDTSCAQVCIVRKPLKPEDINPVYHIYILSDFISVFRSFISVSISYDTLQAQPTSPLSIWWPKFQIAIHSLTHSLTRFLLKAELSLLRMFFIDCICLTTPQNRIESNIAHTRRINCRIALLFRL